MHSVYFNNEAKRLTDINFLLEMISNWPVKKTAILLVILWLIRG